MQDAQLNSVLSTTSNLTVLVPSLQAIENMDEDEKDFWMSKSNIPTLLKYVMVLFFCELLFIPNKSLIWSPHSKTAMIFLREAHSILLLVTVL